MPKSPEGASRAAKTCLVFRHVHFEDLGAFAAPLRAAGYKIRYCDMGVEDPRAAGAADLLAVLGGPIGAYEDESYLFLRDECALIEARLSAGKPILGICLGAQLMARALGARVYPSGVKEIGWKPLSLARMDGNPLAPLGDHPVLHWHGDTFDLPAGAINLASTDVCAHQAFVYGRRALAFQFHPEAEEVGFERWLIGHACEIAAAPGVGVQGLRAGARKYARVSAEAGRRVLRDWLTQLG